MSLTQVHNRMISGSVVNVVDFGAKGDGVTDDTAAFTEFYEALGKTSGRGYVPPGTYRVNPISITPTTPMVVLGAGKGVTTIVKHSDVAGNHLQVNKTTHGFAISDIDFDSRATDLTQTAHGICFVDCSNVLVDTVTVSDTHMTGIISYCSDRSTFKSENIVYKNCYVFGKSHMSNGLLIVDAENSGISGSYAYDCREFSLELKNDARNCWIENSFAIRGHLPGVVLGQQGGVGPSNCRINDVQVVSCAGGIELSNGSNNVFDNIFIDCENNAGTLSGIINASANVINSTFTNIKCVNVPANINPVRFRSGCTGNYVQFSLVHKLSASLVVVFDANSTNNFVTVNKLLPNEISLDARISDNSAADSNNKASLDRPAMTLVHTDTQGRAILRQAATTSPAKLAYSARIESGTSPTILQLASDATTGQMGVALGANNETDVSSLLYDLAGDYWVLKDNVRFYKTAIRSHTPASQTLGLTTHPWTDVISNRMTIQKSGDIRMTAPDDSVWLGTIDNTGKLSFSKAPA